MCMLWNEYGERTSNLDWANISDHSIFRVPYRSAPQRWSSISPTQTRFWRACEDLSYIKSKSRECILHHETLCMIRRVCAHWPSRNTNSLHAIPFSHRLPPVTLGRRRVFSRMLDTVRHGVRNRRRPASQPVSNRSNPGVETSAV